MSALEMRAAYPHVHLGGRMAHLSAILGSTRHKRLTVLIYAYLERAIYHLAKNVQAVAEDLCDLS